jgi:hypothetical protein
MIRTQVGSIELSDRPFRNLLATVRADGKDIKTIREIAEGCNVGIDETLRALLILVQVGIFSPAQDRFETQQAINHCLRLNKEVWDGSIIGQKLRVLASPVTASGIRLSRAQQHFLAAWGLGSKVPTQWARFAWSALERENTSVSASSPTSALLGARLLRKALVFDKLIPIYTGLGFLGTCQDSHVLSMAPIPPSIDPALSTASVISRRVPKDNSTGF